MSTTFTTEQKTSWRSQLAPRATEDQWQYFITECERRSLIPGTHVVFSTRTNKEYNTALGRQVDVEKVVMITTINALRLIAERGKKYEGRGPFTFYYADGGEGSETFKESRIPFGRIPHAVSVEMYRSDWKVPCFSVARYDAYAQKKDGKPTHMWSEKGRGEEQCAKCCEAAGLRTIAPEECGDLYLAEEFNEEPPALVEAAAHAVTPPAPIVAPLAALNQAAAPTNTTQPGPAAVIVKTVVPEPTTPERVQTTVMPPAPKPIATGPKPPAAPRPAAPSPAPAAKPQTTTPAPGPTAPNPVAVTQKRVEARINADERAPRQPHVEEPVKESHAELNEVADRIARDKDPKPSAAPAVPQPVYNDDTPPPPVEYQAFMQRVAKIVRDKLPLGGLKEGAGDKFKAYLLKQAGAPSLAKITKGAWERVLSELETASAEDAAKKVREGHK